MASILPVPEEILDHVGQLLSLRDLRELRLSCRSNQQKILHSFRLRFFEIKSTHLIERELCELVALSQTDYSPFVKKLVIKFVENEIIEDVGPNEVLDEGMWMPALEAMSKNKDLYNTDSRIVLAKESADRYNAFVSEKKATFSHGLHFELLTKALANLHCLKTTKLSDRSRSYFGENLHMFAAEVQSNKHGHHVDNPRSKQVLQSMQMARRLQNNVDIVGNRPHVHPFGILGLCLYNSGRKLEELELEFDVITRDPFDVDATARSRFEISMNKLRRLVLDVHFHPILRRHGTHVNKRLVPGSGNVEELHLRDHTHCMAYMMSQVALSEPAHLSSIHLYKIGIISRVLVITLEPLEAPWNESSSAMFRCIGATGLKSLKEYLNSSGSGQSLATSWVAYHLREMVGPTSPCFIEIPWNLYTPTFRTINSARV